VGMLCGAVGLALLTRVDATSGFGTVLPGYLLFGVALGLVYAPMSSAAMAALPQQKAGIASGVLAMDRLLAGALSVAIGGAIFQAVEAGASGGKDAGFTEGLSAAMWFLAGLVAVGAVLTWMYVRAPSAPSADPAAPHSEAEHQHHRRFHL
jgi:MFS transporter, DHA2 family, methylenomycin A resistance protein